MLEKTLIEQAAPTLAGIKPASLFSYSSTAEALREIACWNKALGERGVRARVLGRTGNRERILVYVYRKSQLEKVLQEPELRRFLGRMGYGECQTVQEHLHCLAGKLRSGESFPHEIGIFLGYPLEDITGFMENNGKNYTFLGCWKSYGDPEKARRRYEQLTRCTNVYRRLFAGGTPLMRLTAAI